MRCAAWRADDRSDSGDSDEPTCGREDASHPAAPGAGVKKQKIEDKKKVLWGVGRRWALHHRVGCCVEGLGPCKLHPNHHLIKQSRIMVHAAGTPLPGGRWPVRVCTSDIAKPRIIRHHDSESRGRGSRGHPNRACHANNHGRP